MNLTVACLFVRGEYPYTVEYVQRLHEGVRRHLARPFRFVCLTDRPSEMPEGVEALPVARTPRCIALWTKLQIFNPAHGFTGRMLYLDLDTLIVSSLDPIVDMPSSLAICTDELKNEREPGEVDRCGRAIVRQYQGSVIVWDAGTQDHLFLDWAPAIAQQWSTDQEWYTLRMRGALGMPYGWFPRISRVHPPWPSEAKVVLVKKPKCHIAADRWPWFNTLWRAA